MAKKKSVKKKSKSKAVKSKSSSSHDKKNVSWLTTLLLSIFLGWLGIDRFFMGQIGLGILKLLITLVTFGIFGWIWWLVDIILIATRYEFKDVHWVE